MVSGISLNGIDPTFDYLVSLMAPKGFHLTSKQYPDFAAMKAAYEATGYLSVNVDHSDSTIFGAPSTNWQFRAWHDSQHLAANSDFSPEGEAIAARRQMDQVVFLNGPKWSDKKRWIALIDMLNGELFSATFEGERIPFSYQRSIEPCGDNYEPCQTPAKPSTVCLHCGWPKRKHPCSCGCGIGQHLK